MPATMAMLNLVLVLGSVLATIAAGTEVTVTVANGPIVGEQLMVQDKRVNRFLGIPYAQPMIGAESWFSRPRPFTDRFDQPYRAVHWPKACHQIRLDAITDFRNETFDHDCLQVNIWSPVIDISDESQLLPVFFFIHGGGLIAGSANQEIFDGAILAQFTNAVVVTVNYRLTTFGLFYADAVPGVKGNQAFWDQVMALEWVHDNIRYFGGDANAVTIAGVSAGSWSVSAHILSPISRRFFRNAMMLSGSVHTQVHSPAAATAMWLNGLRAIGCATETDTSITEPIFQCLLQKDINQIIALPFIASQSLLRPFVVVDGEFFPEHPMEMLKSGNFKNEVNLLVSTMEDEGSCLMPFMYANKPEIGKKFSRLNPLPITPEEARTVLKDLTIGTFDQSMVDQDTIERIYFNGLNEITDSGNTWRRAVGVAYGDLLLGCPTTDFGLELARHSTAGRVYQLFGTYKLGLLKAFSPEWAAASHAEDQWPLFGVPFSDPIHYVQRERDISRELMTFVGSFIRTGQPNQTEQPEWQSYFVDKNGGGQQVVQPYYRLGNEYRTHQNYGFDLKRTECDLWKRLRSTKVA